ncbi:MAG: cytochrome P460 family protein [Gammaproteobacteria bacterium]|nr:cytochrome P460 family protein [Gammaproteobacteria bacterium]
MPRPTQAVIATTCLAVALASTTLSSRAAEPISVAYPADYRSWQHVKSMVIQPGHALYDSFGGIHHLYANPAALRGYASGTFPDGAVIAFDLLEANTADNAVQEGARKVLGVMEKDAKRFAATGGWGFEGFAAGDPVRPVVGSDAATACFGCHTSQKASDYVFSKTR